MQRWKLPELTILRRLLLIAAPAGIVALVVWILSPSDPRYNGKRLSSYLDELGPATLSISLWPSVQIDPWQSRPPEQDEAVKALNALGPKALPLVRHWLQSESSLRNKLRKLAAAPGSRFTWLWRWRWMAKDPRAMAYRAICIIPQDGMPVVPVLRTQILSGGPQALLAEQVLERIAAAIPEEQSALAARQNGDLLGMIRTDAMTNELGASAAQILGILNRREPPEAREIIIRGLWAFREVHARLRHSLFLLDEDGFFHNLLYLESGSPSQKAAAAFLFRDRPCCPERIVPLLSSNLASENITVLLNSCEALASYGTNAAPALPLLTRLQTRRSDGVGLTASNTIARIAGPRSEGNAGNRF